MKKKVAIWIVVILVVALLIGGAIMFLGKNNGEISNEGSGDVSGENIEAANKDINYIDPVNEQVIFGFLEADKLNEYADVQEIRLEENAIKEYFWTMRSEGLENISIDSGETEFVYAEHGVGEVVDRVYKITGVKEGTTTLRFNATYRPRANMEPIQSQTVIYKVSVNADKQVAITEETRFLPIENFLAHQEHVDLEEAEHNNEH